MSKLKNEFDWFSREVVAEIQDVAEMNPRALAWPQPDTRSAALDRLSVPKTEKQVRSF